MAVPTVNHLFGLVRTHCPAEPGVKVFIETSDGARYTYADLLARSALA